MWLIGAMVCLLAAPQVQLSISVGNGWPHNALRHHWLMPISCHFRDCKALLVTSLTHVSGAIGSAQTFVYWDILRYNVVLLYSCLLLCRLVAWITSSTSMSPAAFTLTRNWHATSPCRCTGKISSREPPLCSRSASPAVDSRVKLSSTLSFLPCDVMHSWDYAVERCPSVRPSVYPSVRHLLAFCQNG